MCLLFVDCYRSSLSLPLDTHYDRYREHQMADPAPPARSTCSKGPLPQIQGLPTHTTTRSMPKAPEPTASSKQSTRVKPGTPAVQDGGKGSVVQGGTGRTKCVVFSSHSHFLLTFLVHFIGKPQSNGSRKTRLCSPQVKRRRKYTPSPPLPFFIL